MDDRDKITWKQQLPVPGVSHVTVYSIPKYYFLAETLILCSYTVDACDMWMCSVPNTWHIAANSDMTTALQSVNGCIPCKCLIFWRRRHISVASVPRDVPTLCMAAGHWLAPPGTRPPKNFEPMKMAAQDACSWNLVKNPSKFAKLCFQLDFGDDNFRPCWKHPALWISWAPRVPQYN
jgi:hypothetical protein